MKPHYFGQAGAPAGDMLLGLCKQQGYVRSGCLLGGQVVWGLVNKQNDPCIGCEGPRDLCRGRPKVQP